MSVAVEATSPREAQVVATTTALTPWEFDIRPLHVLPKVDLSVTIESRWLKSVRIRRVLAFLEGKKARTPTFLGYLLSYVCTAAAFVLPAESGRVVAVVGTLLGLPMILVALSALRYEIMLVLLQTYDVWFFGLMSTLTFSIIAILLHDARAVLMVTCWLSFQHSNFIDANVRSARRLWIASVVEFAAFAAIAVYASLGLMDRAYRFDLLRYNGHRLPATAIAHDGMLAILLVLTRNLVRRYQSAVREPAKFIMKCIGFRCRLQLQAHGTEACPRSTSRHRRMAIRPAPSDASTTSKNATQSFLEPFLNTIDARNTLYRINHDTLARWLLPQSLQSTTVRHARVAFKLLGLYGFVAPLVIIALAFAWPSTVSRTEVYAAWALAQLSSICFITITSACFQRDLLFAIFTSFDFMLIVGQGTAVHLVLADVYGWHGANTASLVVSWLWSIWVVCWDALTPPYRQILGLSARFPAFVGTGLVASTAAVAVTLFFILAPSAVHDHVLFQGRILGVDLEFHALTWFFSLLGTISTWSLRVIWRLWIATDSEFVVLDGLVLFEIRSPTASMATSPSSDPAIPSSAPPLARTASQGHRSVTSGPIGRIVPCPPSH